MTYKDKWRDFIRTGEDQSGFANTDQRTTWKQYLFEGELEVVQEPKSPEQFEAEQPISPSEIPGELFHATRPPLLSSISQQGLTDFSDHSRHGTGQVGISFATQLDGLVGGQFGNLILVFDGQELAASGQYEFRAHQDPTVDTPEAEIRATMIDSAATSGSGINAKVDNLGTEIPFHYCRKFVFLYPVPKFEQKWLKDNYPDVEIQIYREEKQASNEE